MRDPQSWIHEHRPVVAMALLSTALVLPGVIGAGDLVGVFSRATPHLLPGFVAVGLMSAVAFQKNSRLATRWPGSILQACAILGLLVIGGVLVVDIEGNRANSLTATRNFYGALAVYSVDSQSPEGHYYMLRHGQIIHGEQYSAADKRSQHTTYYGPDSGIGLVMLNHPRRIARNPRDRTIRVGGIGLGVGTIAGTDCREIIFDFTSSILPSRKSRRMKMDTSPICAIRARKSISCRAMRGCRWSANSPMETNNLSTCLCSMRSLVTRYRCIY